MTPAARRTAWAMVAGGGALFVALAWWLVPWDPVPGGPLEPVRAEEYFSAAHVARAEQYSQWTRVWSWSSLALSIAVACWLGFSRRGRAWAERAPGPWPVQVVVLVAAVELVRRAVTLPFAAALHEHRRGYGLSTQGWGGFLADVVRYELIGIAVTSVALVVVVGLARRLPRAWPAVAGGAVAALVVLGSFVYPVVVEPAFSSFTPLEQGPLRDGIVTLAGREGVEVGEVLVADASQRTTTLNAYVSGFGSTRRVVLYDTLVEDLPTDQALTVVAHELAHAEHDDVLVGTALGAVGSLVGVGALVLVHGRLSRGGRPGAHRPAAVPTTLALVAVLALVSSPGQNGISRQVERRADVGALRSSPGTHEAFEAVQVNLARRSLTDLTPPAWSHWWFASHPHVLERLALVERCGPVGRQARDIASCRAVDGPPGTGRSPVGRADRSGSGERRPDPSHRD